MTDRLLTLENREVLRLSATSITVPEGVTVDDAAKEVIAALEAHIKHIVKSRDEEIERLWAAIHKIDAINDNPAVFNPEINAVIEELID